MKMWKTIALGVGGGIVILGIAAFVVYSGGEHQGPGVVHPAPVPAVVVKARQARQSGSVTPENASPQILFGDLHVHTTFSADAFLRSVPLLNGEGAHPPADACDFARFCSNLDFFALTDHAKSLTPLHWRESLDSIRQCNAVAGDPANPDLVAFAGFEWSQVGATAATHYGHKNVIFHGTGPTQVPTRPIAPQGIVASPMQKNGGISPFTLLSLPMIDFPNRQRYADLFTFGREIRDVGRCPDGVDVHDLPGDCREIAETPRVLFEKLDQWGLDSLVIPHGTSWGFYTPPGYTYDKQISPTQNDPLRQRLIEIYSGHGNAEQYRSWRAFESGADGSRTCPAPSSDYQACCWRAGEIIRSRCGDAPAAVCEQRVQDARKNYLAAEAAGHLTVPGASVEDWGDCGQCRDCFEAPFMHRPGGSAQYILARGNFDNPSAPAYSPIGFVASSDNHTARPGTGYKEFARRKMTEAAGPRSAAWRKRIFGKPEPSSPTSIALTPDEIRAKPKFRILDLECQASFFMTGGLVGVHANGRDRDSIWKALQERHVYGTSGPRILLWFELDNGDGGSAPMGSEIAFSANPHFTVRASGAFKQKPGCPLWTQRALSADRLERLCAGECYNPGDERLKITRIEVVRIQPQEFDSEPLQSLIKDPWRTLPCPANKSTCSVQFDDPDFQSGARDTIYYVRAIQQPTPAINADNLRCEGVGCKKLRPCYGDFRTAYNDQCLADTEQRAWSSPIFVHFASAQAAP